MGVGTLFVDEGDDARRAAFRACAGVEVYALEALVRPDEIRLKKSVDWHENC